MTPEDKAEIKGKIKAFKIMIFDCQRALSGLGAKLKTRHEFDSERSEVIDRLRDHCANHGDNDWADDLHIADIIDKHLMNYIEARDE